MERPEDENINIGISDEDGVLELSIDGTGSSFDEIEAFEKRKKKVKTFSNVWKQSRFFGKEIQFCKIDVEGYEKKVLNGIDFSNFRPWIFVIESMLPGTAIPCFEEWENILISYGYLFACQHGINRYYVEKNRSYLVAGLVNYKKMFLNNDIYQIKYMDNQNYLRNKYWLSRKQKIALFGEVIYMRNFFEFYGEKYKPILLIDNSAQTQDKELYGLKIQQPDILKEFSDKEIAVLICDKEVGEISYQLKEMNFTDYTQYHFVRTGQVVD